MLAQVLAVEVNIRHQKRRPEADEHALVLPFRRDFERALIPRRAAIIAALLAGVGGLAILTVERVPAMRHVDRLPLVGYRRVRRGVVLEKLPAVRQFGNLPLRGGANTTEGYKRDQQEGEKTFHDERETGGS